MSVQGVDEKPHPGLGRAEKNDREQLRASVNPIYARNHR